MSELDPMDFAESQRLAIGHEFLAMYLADQSAETPRSLAAFPGFEAVVEAEWQDLTATQDRRIGPYAVIRELGAGGQAVVYLAADERLGRRVALEVLPRRAATPEQEARLRREARLAARWSDPRICEVYDIGSDDAHFYVAMQLSLPLTSPSFAGMRLCFQAAVLDPGAMQSIAFSDALEVVVGS